MREAVDTRSSSYLLFEPAPPWIVSSSAWIQAISLNVPRLRIGEESLEHAFGVGGSLGVSGILDSRDLGEMRRVNDLAPFEPRLGGSHDHIRASGSPGETGVHGVG